jgi:hypothetical protein
MFKRILNITYDNITLEIVISESLTHRSWPTNLNINPMNKVDIMTKPKVSNKRANIVTITTVKINPPRPLREENAGAVFSGLIDTFIRLVRDKIPIKNAPNRHKKPGPGSWRFPKDKINDSTTIQIETASRKSVNIISNNLFVTIGVYSRSFLKLCFCMKSQYGGDLPENLYFSNPMLFLKSFSAVYS